MSHTRRLAFVAGFLYLLTVVTSIPALALKDPVLADPATAAAGATALHWAAGLEFVLALACIGTAVALFPVVRRVDEATALGFVGSRTLEASIIVMGVLAMLSVTVAGPAAEALVGMHDWAFLVGPGTLPAVNALLLAPLLLRAGLVPRGTVRYLRGVAEGGGPPPVAIVPARWAHGRADLVAHFAGCGSIVTSHAVLRMPAQPGDPVVIQRVVDGGARVLAAVLRALPAGVEVECCVPSTHPAAAWCLGHGFVQSDEDVWCTTGGVLPDAGLAVVHPGLW